MKKSDVLNSPTNGINDIKCVRSNFQQQLEILFPYQLENLTSLVNGDLYSLLI